MKIGFIGLGIMGAPMSRNVIKKHNDTVYVYNRTRAKAEAIAAEGGVLCESALELARQADVIITMVPRSEDSQDVYTSILSALGSGKLCIDMSTIDPAVSRQIATQVKAADAQFIDAPVVKSKAAAESGTLGIYVGGEAAAYERAFPILSYMGSNIKHMGGNGSGLVMKICHNALVAQIQNGVNETILLAQQNGISVADYAEAISYGGGQNAYLDTKKGTIEAEDFTTAFSVENMAKDVDISLRLAEDASFRLAGAENVRRVYAAALEQGWSKEDFSATVKAVRLLAQKA